MKNKDIVSSENDLNNLSERLNYLIKTAGIKKNHLATKLGVSPQTINQLCKSECKSSKHTEGLAKILNANKEWLERGTGQPFLTNKNLILQKKTYQEIPIYTFEQLINLSNFENISTLIPIDIKLTNSTYTNNAFGFYIRDNLLSPQFEKNDIVFVEKQQKIINGSLSLLFSKEFHDIFFCHVYTSEDKKLTFGYLPDPNIGVFLITENDFIYGTFKELLRKSAY